MRIDLYLTERGYAHSRQQAKRLIEEGAVTVDGRIVKKPSETVADGTEPVVCVSDSQRYVGRGGLKLEAALDAFGLCAEGKYALDIGASTGGFTDCLLQRGVSHVCAVDSGEGQLAEKIRHDGRVTSLEHCNARYLTTETVGRRVDLIVMDVSFISATLILPRFPYLLGDEGDAVCLIKPQFEVGRSMIGKGGVVKDRKAHRLAIEQVLEAGRQAGLVPVGLIPSPVLGGDGNREFLVWFSKGRAEKKEVTDEDIRRVAE